jgi:WD40 repeat protein
LGTSAFSPDATRFVLQLKKFYVFDVDSGKQLSDFQAEPGAVIGVAVSRDNEYLLTSQWGRPVETRLADGRRRISAAGNHVVTLRRLRDGSVVKELVLPEGGAGQVAFSPDGKYYATAIRRKDAQIRLFLTRTGEELGQLSGLDSYPTSLAFSRGNRLLASGLRNTTVLVWDLAKLVPGTP